MDKDKKEKPSGAGIEALMVFWFVVIMMIFGALAFLDLKSIQESIQSILRSILFYLVNFFAHYFVFSIFFSIALMILVIIYSYRFEQLRKKVMAKITVPTERRDQVVKQVNPAWKNIEDNIITDDPNKWKMAILEADVMLGELLEKMNLPGDNIGEKLKAIERSDFPSLDDAWEAHKMRNSIAHAGSDFQMSERDARRTIALFEKIFRDFNMI